MTTYRDALKGWPQVVWKWGEKVAFSCLQRVNKTQLFHPISRNLGPTFKSIPARRGRHALSPEGGTLAAPVLVYCSLTTGCPKVTVMVWTANIFFTWGKVQRSWKLLARSPAYLTWEESYTEKYLWEMNEYLGIRVVWWRKANGTRHRGERQMHNFQLSLWFGDQLSQQMTSQHGIFTKYFSPFGQFTKKQFTKWQVHQ